MTLDAPPIRSTALSPVPVEEVSSDVLTSDSDTQQLKGLFASYPYREHQRRLLRLDREQILDNLTRNVAAGPGPHLIVRRRGQLEGLLSVAPYGWVSEQLGVSVACLRHLVVQGDDRRRVATALVRRVHELLDGKVRCLCTRVSTEDRAAVLALQELGHTLVGAEVTGVVSEPRGDERLGDGIEVGPLRADEIEAVGEIAGASHRFNHFRADPRFDAAKVDRMFARLIGRRHGAPLGETLVARSPEGEPLGFICVSWNERLRRSDGRRVGTLDFIAVRPGSGRKGIGDRLNRAGLAFLWERAVAGVTVRTMVHNYAALAVLRRIGYRPSSANFIFHGWMS